VLVLRRRVGEAIVLGDDIEIEIVEISRTRVKLGVTAPRNVTVVRREAVAVAAENRRASHVLSSCGTEGIEEVLRLLKNLSGGIAQGPPRKADM
jgi:carbon storage regulator